MLLMEYIHSHIIPNQNDIISIIMNWRMEKSYVFLPVCIAQCRITV